MSQELVRLSTQAFLILSLLSSQGCGEGAGPKNPRAEDARSALIELIQSSEFKDAGFISNEESIKELKIAPISAEGTHVKIGRWYCDLSGKTFVIQRNTRISSFELHGRFVLGRNGRWKAVEEGSSIGCSGPQPVPHDELGPMLTPP